MGRSPHLVASYSTVPSSSIFGRVAQTTYIRWKARQGRRVLKEDVMALASTRRQSHARSGMEHFLVSLCTGWRIAEQLPGQLPMWHGLRRDDDRNPYIRDTAHVATTVANALHSCQSTAACEWRYLRISRQM